MCFVPKRCNDMMNVGRLQGFEVNVSSGSGLDRVSNRPRPPHCIETTVFFFPAVIQGQNHSSGQTAAAGHLHRHRAGEQLPVQGQGEAGLPLRAAGHLQRANRPQERLLHPWVHLQEQHKGGRLAGLTPVWPQSVFEGSELHRRVDFWIWAAVKQLFSKPKHVT